MGFPCKTCGLSIRSRAFRVNYFVLTPAWPGDVIICGKGHEQSMAFGAVEYPWDDRQATEKPLEAWTRGEEMGDLGLPTFGGSDE